MCTSRASQTGNLSILTSSCLGRHKDEAASWAGAGAHGSPGWRRGDEGHEPRVRGTGGRFPSTLRVVPGGKKEQRSQGKPRQRCQPDRSRQARQPTASFPPPPREAAPGTAAFPRGAHAAADTQHPGAAGQDGGHKAPTLAAPLPSPALGSPPQDGSSPCQGTFPAPARWARRGSSEEAEQQASCYTEFPTEAMLGLALRVPSGMPEPPTIISSKGRNLPRYPAPADLLQIKSLQHTGAGASREGGARC